MRYEKNQKGPVRETGSAIQYLKDGINAEPVEVSNLVKFSLTKPDFE